MQGKALYLQHETEVLAQDDISCLGKAGLSASW